MPREHHLRLEFLHFFPPPENFIEMCLNKWVLVLMESGRGAGATGAGGEEDDDDEEGAE